MVNYKVTNYQAHINSPANQTADVIEIKTGQVIESGIPVKQAKELCRSLNFGSGFNGNTPAFFLQKTKCLEFQEESFYK
jgi:hypothetical protein